MLQVDVRFFALSSLVLSALRGMMWSCSLSRNPSRFQSPPDPELTPFPDIFFLRVEEVSETHLFFRFLDVRERLHFWIWSGCSVLPAFLFGNPATELPINLRSFDSRHSERYRSFAFPSCAQVFA